MLNWILLILVLIVMVILLTWIFSKIFGRGEHTQPLPPQQEQMEANRHAIGEGRLDDVAFNLEARGYNQEQVDDAIGQLQWQIQQLKGEQGGQGSVDPVTEE